MDKLKYPQNWDAIANEVKNKADWLCLGCNKLCRKPKESCEDFSARTGYSLSDVTAHPQRWTLTVAHLNHVPMDCREENLKALCSVCHLAYDLEQHKKTRSGKRYRDAEAGGQLTLCD
ncbi:MAG: HNH endonuclease [Cyanobacteriota bacterium]